MSTDSAVVVTGLGKRYLLGPQGAQSGFWRRKAANAFGLVRGKPPAPSEAKEHWALRDVSFTVGHGERIGIIGRNGAGKSTLLKILSRVVAPTTGEVRIRGRLTSLLEVGTGFKSNLSGRENIYLNASLHGLTKKEIDDRFSDIVDFSELARFIDTPVKNYSSGMRARLGFSIAAHLDPDILLLDEVLSVGDAAFQQKCLGRMNEITAHDRTLFFVSHSTSAIRQFCSRCIWLNDGQILADGPADEVVEQYTSQVLTGKASVVFSRLDSSPTMGRPAEESLAKPVAERSGEISPWAVLHTVQALDTEGMAKTSYTADEPIHLRVKYEVSADKPVYPAFRIYQDDTLLFTIAYWQDTFPRSKGTYISEAVIPPHLLNVGRLSVSVGLNTPIAGRLLRHDVAENALTIFVHEARKPPYPLGPYQALKGAVRPACEWKTSKDRSAHNHSYLLQDQAGS